MRRISKPVEAELVCYGVFERRTSGRYLLQDALYINPWQRKALRRADYWNLVGRSTVVREIHTGVRCTRLPADYFKTRTRGVPK